MQESRESQLPLRAPAWLMVATGALALSDKFYRVGTGATSAQAMSRALAECPGCRIAQVACEDGGNEARLVSR